MGYSVERLELGLQRFQCGISFSGLSCFVRFVFNRVLFCDVVLCHSNLLRCVVKAVFPDSVHSGYRHIYIFQQFNRLLLPLVFKVHGQFVWESFDEAQMNKLLSALSFA